MAPICRREDGAERLQPARWGCLESVRRSVRGQVIPLSGLSDLANSGQSVCLSSVRLTVCLSASRECFNAMGAVRCLTLPVCRSVQQKVAVRGRALQRAGWGWLRVSLPERSPPAALAVLWSVPVSAVSITWPQRAWQTRLINSQRNHTLPLPFPNGVSCVVHSTALSRQHPGPNRFVSHLCSFHYTGGVSSVCNPYP